MGAAYTQAELFEPPNSANVIASTATPLPSATAPGAPLKDKINLAIEGMLEQMREGNHLLCLTSMGQDSNVLCTLALHAIHRALDAGVHVPHVLFGMSDTEYENPIVGGYAKQELMKLDTYIRQHNLPASVVVATPSLTNDYVVNMIGGRGVASVSGMDRNCSVQLKVSVGRRMKAMAKKHIKGRVVNVVGKRWDESAYRQANMAASGERPDMPVVVNGEPLLCPIAHFSFDNLWELIGMVHSNHAFPASERYLAHSDFATMIKVYRESNGGECEVTAFMHGKPSTTSCGGRHGCHVCLQVGDDKSMENMLTEYPFLRPLNVIRNWLGAIHFDPKQRRWLSREPNADGELRIEPNAYSPDACRSLLRYYLSAQADEEIRAAKGGEAPMFEVIPERKLIAIQLLWLRNGYHEPWAALRDWKAVYERGERWYPPVAPVVASRKDFPRPTPVHFPLKVLTDADPAQLRSAAQLATDPCSGGEQDTTIQVPLNDDGEFSVDQDGAECFIGFLADDAIAKSDQQHTLPSDQLRTLLNIGTVSLRKANTGYWEKVMTVADTLVKHGVPAIIDNPEKLLQWTDRAA